MHPLPFVGPTIALSGNFSLLEVYLVHGNQRQSARMVRGVGQRGCQHI